MSVTAQRRAGKSGEGSIEVGQLKTGDFFGERSLLTEEPIAATITVIIPLFLNFSKPQTRLQNSKPILIATQLSTVHLLHCESKLALSIFIIIVFLALLHGKFIVTMNEMNVVFK